MSNSLVSFAPPVEDLDPGVAPPLPADRLCEDVLVAATEDLSGLAADRRNQAFWDERRLIDRFPEIDIPVLITHGFHDGGHELQESAIWDSLPNAPKLALKGQWGHEFPNFNTPMGPDRAMGDWNRRLLEWLDHWLLGVGPAPATGMVEYEDSRAEWHTSTSWPPTEANLEALYIWTAVH